MSSPPLENRDAAQPCSPCARHGFDLRPQLASLRVPVSIVSATDDRLTPPVLQEQLAEAKEKRIGAKKPLHELLIDMGFIKEDVRRMNAHNLDELKNRVVTYSNFISRIIYDMKWYDQDANTIINPIFRTNINAIIEFIVRHVFLRTSSKNEMFEFCLALWAFG